MRDLLFWTLGLVCGGLLVYYRTERKREDAVAAKADLRRMLGGVQSHEAKPWPKPLHPREFDDMTQPVLREARYTPPPPPIDWHRNEHQRLSRGWWVEQAQRVGTRVWDRIDPPGVGRHRPERVPAPTVRAIAAVPSGPITQEFQRITADFDDRPLLAGYYSSVAAHVVAAREAQ